MGISQHIELRHLRCLAVLAEELNFRRAAERLHMTQPPLSRTIAQLEALLGGRLFERSRTHCALTPLGAAVAADAARVLADLDARASRWVATDDTRSPLRLGLFFALNPRHFSEIEQAVHARLTDTDVRLVVDRTHHLLSQLHRRRLDAALVLLPAPTAGLPVLHLAETEMVALLPASSPLARKRRVRVADLATIDALLFMRERENPPLYRYLDEALRQRGLHRPRYRVPADTYSGLADVAAGQACTIVCRTMVDRDRGDLAFRRLHADERIVARLGLVHDPALAADRLEALRAGVQAYLERVLT